MLKEKDVAVLLNVDAAAARESDPYDAAYANAAALQRAGVRFAIVTDDAPQSRNLPYEAAMARAFGLPGRGAARDHALAGRDLRRGRPPGLDRGRGKDANLFLATGDIMDPRTQVTHVFIDGVPQSLETRHTRLYQEFKDRP